MPVPDLGAGNTTENALAAGLIDERTAQELLSLPRPIRKEREGQLGLYDGSWRDGLNTAIEVGVPTVAGIALGGAGLGALGGGLGGGGGASGGGGGAGFGGGDSGGFFGNMFRGLTGGEGEGFGGTVGNLLGSFGGMARDAISSIDPMQAAMLPFAIQEARQASKDREFSRDLAHQGIDHFGQAADIAMGDWEQRAPMRDAFIEGAMGFHEQHNPFATDPMAGMGGPQQPPPQQQMPEIQGPPSLDHLMQNPGFVFGGGGGGGGGGHPAPVSGGYPADPQFGPNEIPVDGIHQRII